MTRKYLFFDIDGTLTISHTNTVAPSTIEALKRCRKEGHFVAIASGRPHFLTRDIATLLDIHSWVCDGGHGMVMDDDYVHYEPINQIIARSILNQCTVMKMKHLCNTSDSSKAYSTVVDDEFVRQFPDELYDVEVLKNYENIHEIRRIVIDLQNERKVILAGIDLVDHMQYHGNLVIEPTSKYKGIRKLTEMIGGSEEDIIVFGDGMNDIDMFSNAKTKVAMGDAVQEIKDLATFVTGTSKENGIYDACLKLDLFKA